MINFSGQLSDKAKKNGKIAMGRDYASIAKRWAKTAALALTTLAAVGISGWLITVISIAGESIERSAAVTGLCVSAAVALVAGILFVSELLRVMATKPTDEPIMTTAVSIDEYFIIWTDETGEIKKATLGVADRVYETDDCFYIVLNKNKGYGKLIVCQKDLQTEGSAEDFREVFKNKIRKL